MRFTRPDQWLPAWRGEDSGDALLETAMSGGAAVRLDEPGRSGTIGQTSVEVREVEVADIKVHHLDGRVWYVRRRWARRRLPWAGRGRRALPGRLDRRQAAGVAQGGTLQDLDEDLTEWMAMQAKAELVMVIVALVVGSLLVAGLVMLAHATITWLRVHPRVLAGGAIALVAVALLVPANLLVGRPRLVIAERLGLEEAPVRVWRVVGRRRSRELARRVAEAIRSGRMDSGGLLATPTPGIPDAEAPDSRP